MNILLSILYWLAGIFLTGFAGRTTYFSSIHALVIERPLNALVVASIWVFVAYKYMQYLQQP